MIQLKLYPIESQKVVAMATSLSGRVYRQYLYSVGRPLKPPSITNRLVAIVHTKPVMTILVPTLVAMATSLRPSTSGMSSLDSLIPKTYY